MDQIEFKITIREANEQSTTDKYPIICILINRIDLIELLKKFEESYANKEGKHTLAGAYEGLTPFNLYDSLINQEGDKVFILGCTCGVESCWPMKIKITETNDAIIWSDFEQPFRNEQSHHFWNYTSFGKFEFDKIQYQKELKKLSEYIENKK